MLIQPLEALRSIAGEGNFCESIITLIIHWASLVHSSTSYCSLYRNSLLLVPDALQEIHNCSGSKIAPALILQARFPITQVKLILQNNRRGEKKY